MSADEVAERLSSEGGNQKRCRAESRRLWSQKDTDSLESRVQWVVKKKAVGCYRKERATTHRENVEEEECVLVPIFIMPTASHH